MFNWVCPTCGKDVPPSKTECPYCAERAKEAAAAPPPPGYPPQGWQPPPPPQQQQQTPISWQPAPAPPGPQPWQPPPPQQWQPAAAPPVAGGAPPPPPPFQHDHPHPHPHQQHPPQPQHAAWQQPAPRTGPPTWLMFIGFTLAFLGIGAGVYWWIQRSGHTNIAEKRGLENPANPAAEKVTNPMQKFIEVTGIRLMTQDKKPTVRFLVVNHSNAEVPGLAGNVSLVASTSRSEEDAIGTFSFKINSLPASGSQELTAPLKTKLKGYELPDWQNAVATLQITSPAP